MSATKTDGGDDPATDTAEETITIDETVDGAAVEFPIAERLGVSTMSRRPPWNSSVGRSSRKVGPTMG
ncbi:hypothetical protein [Natrinema versiforme]|uniref:Uncharacterized protein n=1 Tax=Natrinema versiforme TaxID=88724 RepID=A0A4V1G0A2_9EURY|nr:hypothetical protein [Natrinema versiforme]QCS44636.1 hypothetical protein FEJ81_20210 [Natrinema versiforme]